MSQHPTLKVSGKIRKKRNVLKRFERIDILSKDGRWKEGDKVLGLPKTKSEDWIACSQIPLNCIKASRLKCGRLFYSVFKHFWLCCNKSIRVYVIWTIAQLHKLKRMRSIGFDIISLYRNFNRKSFLFGLQWNSRRLIAVDGRLWKVFRVKNLFEHLVPPSHKRGLRWRK